MSLTPEQKRIRRTGISGTDVAAICNLNPHRTPLDVFRDKVHGIETEETLAMEVGTALEPVLLRQYAKRFGVTLSPGATLRHPEHPLVIATPDSIHPDGFPVEIKNTERWENWGPDGSDEVPEHYRIQSIWQQAVLQAPHGDMLAMLGRYDVRWYRIPWDGDYFQTLLDICDTFHRDHIATEKPPPPDGSEAWSDFLKERFPVERVALMEATHEAEDWAKKWLSAEAIIKTGEKLQETARQYLELVCGDAAGIAGDGWKLSWKATKGQSRVDWKTLCAELGVKDDMVEKHTYRVPTRPFRLTRVKQTAKVE